MFSGLNQHPPAIAFHLAENQHNYSSLEKKNRMAIRKEQSEHILLTSVLSAVGSIDWAEKSNHKFAKMASMIFLWN